MGYYDIDDVLADSVSFPCKFQYYMPGLGYLEGNPGRPIEKNSKLDLPLWLARILAIVGGESEGDEVDNDPEDAAPFVELLGPDIFSAKVINAIKAGASTLDLNSINSHFYSLIVKWLTLFGDKELTTVFSDMLLERSLEINSHASSVNMMIMTMGMDSQHLSSEATNAGSTFLLTMDEFEKKIYKQAHDSYKETKKWMVQK